MKENKHNLIPDSEIALVSELAERRHKDGRPLNINDVQSLVFLAQESLGLPTRYVFEMSLQGPSCADLRADIDLADSVGAITIRLDANGSGNFVIFSSTLANNYKSRAAGFIDSTRQSLEKISRDFLDLASEQVELCALILFSAKMIGQEDNFFQIREVVRELRPRMTIESIDSTITNLRLQGYLGA